MSESLALSVRRSDPDRYFSALAAAPAKRPHLIAIYALNHELARVGETVREPMLGEIRLQWWREALEGARAGKPRRHSVVEAMAGVFSAIDLDRDLFDRMIDARAFDVSTETFANGAALDAYLDAISGSLMRIAARVLGAGAAYDLTASQFGIAYGLAGVARSLGFHARRGKCYAPLTILNSAGVRHENLLDEPARLKDVARSLAALSVECYRTAKAIAPRGMPLAAFLPAALVPLYARRVAGASFDPFNPDVPLHRRIGRLFSATMTGKI